jgi:hypothetical protein
MIRKFSKTFTLCFRIVNDAVLIDLGMIILSLFLVEMTRAKKIKFMSDLTRDLAQLIYFSMTMLGLLGCSTDIQINRRFSLDSITIFTVALCCLIMSSKFISNMLGNKIMIVVNIITNGAGFIYIMMIFSQWAFGESNHGIPDDHPHIV